MFCAGALLTLGFTNVWASEFDLPVLAAGCQPDPRGGNVTVTHDSTGRGVTFKSGSTGKKIVLYCPLHASVSNYFNAITIVALDDTPNASATAILYRQLILYNSPPGAPEPLAQVTTVDTAGAQNTLNADFEVQLDELRYQYWIEVVITRSDTSARIVVYGSGLHDVL